VQSRFVVHGLLVGVVAAVIYVALTLARPEPMAYVIAHGLKLLGGRRVVGSRGSSGRIGEGLKRK